MRPILGLVLLKRMEVRGLSWQDATSIPQTTDHEQFPLYAKETGRCDNTASRKSLAEAQTMLERMKQHLAEEEEFLSARGWSAMRA